MELKLTRQPQANVQIVIRYINEAWSAYVTKLVRTTPVDAELRKNTVTAITNLVDSINAHAGYPLIVKSVIICDEPTQDNLRKGDLVCTLELSYDCGLTRKHSLIYLTDSRSSYKPNPAGTHYQV